MEIEMQRAFWRKGHIRHQIDAAGLELLQAFFPCTGNITELPFLFSCDCIQQVDQYAGWGSIGIGEYLGFVLIEADTDLRCTGVAGQAEKAYAEEDAQCRQDSHERRLASVALLARKAMNHSSNGYRKSLGMLHWLLPAFWRLHPEWLEES